jgi:DNA-binding transcriptional regulator LsrR (DeoR family)
MTEVARRHYLGGESKTDIAREMGISRFKVARLLDLARELGVVRIEIVGPPGIDAEKSELIREHYGLTHVVVVRTDTNGSDTRRRVGSATARLLTEIITGEDVLGLAWSRAVNDMVEELEHMPSVPVVQLCGALVVDGEDSSSVEVATRAARVSGGRSYVFYAPLILEDGSSAATLRRHPAVKKALDQASRVTVAVVGVGAWRPGASTIFDACSDRTREEGTTCGIAGEIAGVFFDAEGNLVDTPLTDRLITLSREQLAAIPTVIATAYGENKTAAVIGAIQAGLVSSLVTTTEIADGLIAALGSSADGTAS